MASPSSPETDQPVPFEDREPQAAPFPIVGVGASAGGLEAFSRFLEALPDHTGMAFVLIQHLDPTHKSELTAILSRSTCLPISQVTDGMPIEPNQVYVIPPNTLLRLANRAFHLMDRPVSASPSLTVDHFFTSLAQEQSRLAIGVVLSGTGSDGAEGLKAIKSACGITFAQEESSAKYPSMPRSAAATGIVDFVLPPAQIAQELARLSRDQYVVPPSAGGRNTQELLPEGEAELQEIFSLLFHSTGVDFSRYKQPTMRRRIARRMVVHRLTKLPEYVTILRQHPEESKELFRDVLINVTSFFRDPDAFAALAAQLSLSLPTKQLNGKPFRVWVAGCSTGEEVYSLAICLHELFEVAGLHPRLQLFGTDLSEGALAIARSGLYPERIQEELSRERLNRYFTKMDGKFQISKAIRDACVFARHDVTRDTPFSQLDLISCRNVLIYLDSVLQQGLFPSLHYGLRPNGLLFLGTAETVGSSTDLFTVVDAKYKIFRRQPGPARLDRFSTWHAPATSTFTEVQVATAVQHQRLGNRVERLIRERYAPDGVVINREWQILQFRGHTGFYLEPAPGEASYHLLRMARGDLAYCLRDVISAAMQQNRFVEKTGIRVEQGGESREIAVEVSPLDGDSPSDSCYLVVFRREGTQTVSSPPAPPPESADRRVERLEQELAAARRYQHAVSEEHDAALEELRALNEELRSANEELQSSNEEIGTTKEELQSSNEELTTLNEELDTRNQQLALVNDDLQNLFAATPSALLKVDREFYVRRCTAAAERLGITPADLHHPVRDLQSRLGTLPDLESSIRRVIDTLTGQTCDFQDREGCWWSLSLRPYRAADHRIEGAVLTFTETDKMQRALQASDQARRAADAIIETVREPFVILTPDLRVERANASFYQFFQVTPAQTEGQILGELGKDQWDLPLLRTQLEQVLSNHSTLTDFEVTYTRPGRETRVLLLNARPMSQGISETEAILLAFEDVTERRNRELESARQIQETGQELDRSKEELRALANSVITAREEEARRIARELHDDFSQRLAFLKMTMEKERLGPFGKNHPEVEAALTRFEGQIAELSHDVRNLSHRLHPTVLDDLGLTPALRNLAEEAELVRSAPVQFRVEAVPASLPPSSAAALYRIAQEALRNATKHAPDAPVTITLTAAAGVLRLTISDTGPGFLPTMVRGAGGLGIVTMQERAHLVGGELRLWSEPGQGTTITAEIPWPTEEEDDRTPADHRG